MAGRRGAESEGILGAAVTDTRGRAHIIAIDGPVGAGKSTVARAVARRLRYRYINSGAMYRAVALEALRRGISPQDPTGLAEIARNLIVRFRETPEEQRIMVQGEDVTEAVSDPSVSEAASLVSVHPPVREALVAQQRQLGVAGGVVMEGRDIGTVVFPDADLKVFLSASPEERARRRYWEIRSKGLKVEFEDIRAAEEARDQRDAQRAHSPMQVAEDAIVVDTTGKSADEVVEEILALYRSRLHVV